MPQAKIIYETYGRLAADGRNAVLTRTATPAAITQPAAIRQTAVSRGGGAAGVNARYFEIDSELGHSASGPEHAKWSPVLREFLEPLMAKLG